MSVSLRASINAKCKDCIYDPKSGLGHWRQQVTLCRVTKCALYAVRPTSKARAAADTADDCPYSEFPSQCDNPRCDEAGKCLKQPSDGALIVGEMAYDD